MSDINNELVYRITVSGINSFVNKIPVSGITGAFVAGEIVSGATSGASAVLDRNASIGGAGFLYVRGIDGDFAYGEDLAGSATGLAVKDGVVEVVEELYTDSNYDITAGQWVIDTTGDMITKLGNATQKINLSQGGTFATGYGFNFEVTNLDFAKTILSTGLYFKHAEIKLDISLATGPTYVQEWTGIIDTFSTDEGVVSFNCIDAGKQNIEKIGSELVPITLNKNYNCKIPFNDSEVTKYTMNVTTLSVSYDYGLINELETEVIIFQGYPIASLDDNLASNFNDGFIRIVSGVGAGNVYKIYKAEKGDPTYGTNQRNYRFFVNEDVSSLKTKSNATSSENTSVMEIFSTVNDYNLSKREVMKVHDMVNILTEKPLNVTDSTGNYQLSTDQYNLDSQTGIDSQLALTGQESPDSLNVFSRVPLPFTENSTVPLWNTLRQFKLLYTISDLSKLNNLVDNGSDIILEPLKLTLTGVGTGGTMTVSKILLSCLGKYNNITGNHYPKFFTDVIYTNVSGVSSDYALEVVTVGNDLEITFRPEYNLDLFTIDNYNNPDNSVLEYMVGEFYVTLAPTNVDTTYDGTHTFSGINAMYGGDVSTDTISVGCNGENVFQATFPVSSIGTQFVKGEIVTGDVSGETATVTMDTLSTDSIMYVKDTFSGAFNTSEGLTGSIAGIAVKNSDTIFHDVEKSTPDATLAYLLRQEIAPLFPLDLDSFIQANDDYDLFNSVAERNMAQQLIGEIDVNALLKDFLYYSHLGLYIGRNGNYYLNNWLPKSIVFGTTQSIFSFTSANILENGISKIRRDNLNNITSDFELESSYNASTSKFDHNTRIKNTNTSSFDIAENTEGVSNEDTGLATSAFYQLNAGSKRIRKQSQTKKSCKWFQSILSDGRGNTDAVAFIRNQSAHSNREHEYITVQVGYKADHLALELLSFIDVTDAIITDGYVRTGWIVERRLLIASSKIEFKILLDINPLDPFIQRVNIWQDTHDSVEEKVDTYGSTNVIQNGDGI